MIYVEVELVHKSNGGTVEHNYVYSSDWVDQLISYDGKAITYDNIGNPLNYMGKTMTWDYGRRLMSVLDGSNMLNFAYDLNGNRIAKNNIRYYYSADGLLVSETHSGYDINYIYGANGSLLGFKYRGQTYYYHYSPMGDVMAIYTSPTNVVARYHYGPWGELLYITNGSNANVSSDPTHIANINPIRYRGYYYDTETGFYFLQSRYYDPQTHRFINADGYISTGQGILGYNMYAYCGNNPINMADPSGEIAVTTLILIGSIVAGTLVAGHTAATSYKYTGKVDIGNTLLAGASTFLFCYTAGMSAYGMYVSYCDYKGYVPVTNIGSSQSVQTPTIAPGKGSSQSVGAGSSSPYANLEDSPSVGPGKDFTQSQKSQIIEQNRNRNGGVVRSDMSGIELTKPEKSQSGVTPSPYEWQIDHIVPKSAGGTNSFANAQVLSRAENRIKWDK